MIERRVAPLLLPLLARIFVPDEKLLTLIKRGVGTTARMPAMRASIFAKIKRDLSDMREMRLPRIQEGADRSPLPAQVKAAQPRWRSRGATMAEALGEHAATLDQTEILALFLLASIAGRRLYQRYLWRRFGYDVRRGTFRRGAVPPAGGRQGFFFYWAQQEYAFRNNGWLDCLWALFPWYDGRCTLDEALAKAVERMHHQWEAYPLYMAAGLQHEDPEIQRIATGLVGAWAVPRINLAVNKRLYEALRREAAMRGDERRFAWDMLLELLPDNVSQAYQAWRAGTDHTPRAFLLDLASLVEDDCPDQAPGERLSTASLPKMTQEIQTWSNLTTAIEEWQARQEARRDLKALCAKAALPQRMQEALLLKSEGLSEKQIAERMRIHPDTAKDYVEGGKKRLSARR